MGYPDGLLKTRAVVKPGEYSVIPRQSRVINVIPYFQKCDISILASPKMGASFVQYVGVALHGGGTIEPFAAQDDIESFLFVMDGAGGLEASAGDHSVSLAAGGFIYSGPGEDLRFANNSGGPVRFLLYKQRYTPLDNVAPPSCVTGNINAIREQVYDDMENVFIRDLLPAELSFDMNMHVLSFDPGGSHPFIETHVQEHGAYVLEGEGIYLLGEQWIQVEKEDFIFFGPFIPQAVYATGRGRLTYIYSKDCNRDAML